MVQKSEVAAEVTSIPAVARDRDSYIIGIGASAGGLEAIKSFFNNVPPSCKHSFVLIQHLSPDHKSLMADLLKKNTQLPIVEAGDGMSVERGSVYLIPPKKNLELRNGLLVLSDKPINNGLNLPIDIFFKSLAREEGASAIGVILTGTGSDGTRGVRAIKEAGGMVMVQDPVEAMFDGMPLSAINTGIIDSVLPVEEMPLELQSFIDHPTTQGSTDRLIETDTELLSLVISRVKATTDLDFTHYKRPTLARRIERRMGIKKCISLDQYLSLIHNEPKEAEALSRECLIGVTKFFRDPEAWASLAKNVLPDIVRQRSDERQPIRVWSVGCSTGEEVFTLAILLDEAMERQGRHCDVKIFATDLSEQHLAIASRGQYSESILADVEPTRLNKYFVRKGDEYQTTESLRSMAIFSPHNVINDPPFKDIDLVVCRNMMIYLQPIAQQKAMASLHYSLKINGTMMLGLSESIGDFKVALKEIDAKSKLYRNESPSRGFGLDLLKYPDLQPKSRARNHKQLSLSNRAAEVLSEALTEELGLAAVFVDDSFDILHAAGEIRNFAELPQQGFSSNLLKLLDNNLSAAVSTAVRKAKLQTAEVHYKGVRVVREDSMSKVNLVVKPFTFDGPDWHQCYAVIFLPQDTPSEKATDLPIEYHQDGDSERLLEVEQELKDTRESLQAAIEELETTNEELQATNEELQSTNEELQSMNEELHTVNSEHQQKIGDLAELNADMDNLMQSTEIGTIFLDQDMRIRKFTPVIQQQFNLRSIDIGRPLAHFTNIFSSSDNDRLLEDAMSVLHSGETRNVEISSGSNETELVKLVPFRARSGDVDGVVMSFVDVTELKEVQQEYAYQNTMFQQVLEGAMAGYWEYQSATNSFQMSASFKAMLGYADDQIPNTMEGFRNIVARDDLAMVEETFMKLGTVPGDGLFELEARFRHKTGETVWVWCRGKIVEREDEQPIRTIGCFVDITAHKLVQVELERSNDELKQFAYLTSHDLQEPLRTVSNFVEVLERKYSDALDESGQQYLGIVSQATERMQGLIRGILDYSRIGRDGVESMVDTESIVENVLQDLSSSLSEASAEVEVKSLPKVLGYESELRTLFANLISNAIKFRRPDVPPKVRIYANRSSKSTWNFSIEDNGIGVLPEYHERIFEIFNRLHTRDEFEGAGIGLAHCRKIVELHRGELSMRSAANEGSVFEFTLSLG